MVAALRHGLGDFEQARALVRAGDLLGARAKFEQAREQGVAPELAQRALGAVHGVDLNPFAVAIARFRLIVAALNACAIKRLTDAPGWQLQLACGDSLLHGPRDGQFSGLGSALATPARAN